MHFLRNVFFRYNSIKSYNLPNNARKWPLNARNSFIHILLPFIIFNAFKGHVILMVITAHLKN